MPTAAELLVESARRYPFNWSCWLDLADVCMKDDMEPPPWPLPQGDTTTAEQSLGESAAFPMYQVGGAAPSCCIAE